MKAYTIGLLLACTSLKMALQAELSPEQRDFVNRHTVPSELKKILDQHTSDLTRIIRKCNNAYHCKVSYGVKEFDWLPGYLVKYNMSRIMGAEKLRACIEKHNLNLIKIPEKYLYHIPGTPDDLLNANYLVIVKKVTPVAPYPFNAEQVRQLSKLIRKLGFWEIYSKNLFQTENGTITIIDTEIKGLNEDKKLTGFSRFISWSGKIIYDYGLDREAIAQVFREMHDYCKDKPGKRKILRNRCKESFKTIKEPFHTACIELFHTHFPGK